MRNQVFWNFEKFAFNFLKSLIYAEIPLYQKYYRQLQNVNAHLYSSLPNKRTAWNFDKNQISVQGTILIKILECRVKTGNLVHNKRDFWRYT